MKGPDEAHHESTHVNLARGPLCLRDRQVAMAAHLPLAGGSACECGDMTALLGSIAK